MYQCMHTIHIIYQKNKTSKENFYFSIILLNSHILIIEYYTYVHMYIQTSSK